MTLSQLIRSHREQDCSTIPYRTWEMEMTGLKCRCGRCTCCRMATFVKRIRKLMQKGQK